jgi:hypothetical protein
MTWRPDGMDDDREGAWLARLGCASLIVAVLLFIAWAVWMRCHPVVAMAVPL